MLSARFVSEGISDFVEVEAAIDDWLDAGSIDGSHEIHLVLSAADIEVGGPGTLGQSITAVAIGGHIALIGVLTGRAGEVATHPRPFPVPACPNQDGDDN